VKDRTSLFLGALFVLLLLAAAVEILSGSREGDDTERARFMLECVADWQYAPATCEAMLEGARPPAVPDAMGEPGC